MELFQDAERHRGVILTFQTTYGPMRNTGLDNCKHTFTLKLGFHVRMRQSSAACDMRQQMATVETRRSDSICADAVCGADTDASN